MKHPKVIQRLCLTWLVGIITTISGCTPQNALLIPGSHIGPSQQHERDREHLLNALAGTILLRRNAVDEALQYYRKVAHESDDPALLEEILSIALGNRRYESAVPIAEKIVALSPAPQQSLRQNLLLLYAQTRLYDKAIDLLDTMVEDEEINQETFLAVGSMLARQSDNYAMEFAQTLVERYPEYASAHLMHAVLSLQVRQFSVALEAIDRALAKGINEKKGALIKAHILISDGRGDEGLSLIRAQLEHNKDDTKLRNLYASFLMRSEKYEEAYEQYLEQYRALDQDSGQISSSTPEILLNLAYAAMQIPDLDNAVVHLNALLAWPAYKARGIYYLGRIAEQRKAYNAAAQRYSQISPQTPALFIEALLARARIYHLEGNHEQAVRLLEQNRTLVADEGTLARIYLMHGNLLSDIKRYNDAYRIFSDGLNATSTNNASLLFARALASFEMKNLPDAEVDLKKILLKDPNNSQALNALGYMLADMNIRLDEAKQYIERAYQLKPDEAAIIDSMGWLAFRMNNLDSAEKFLRMALQQDEQAEIIGHLTEVLLHKGMREAAHDLLKKGLEKFPNDEYLLKLRQQADM